MTYASSFHAHGVYIWAYLYITCTYKDQTMSWCSSEESYVTLMSHHI